MPARKHDFVRGAAAVSVALALASLAACLHGPAWTGPRPPLLPGTPDEAYYEAPGPVPVPASEEVEERTSRYEVRHILLPARVPPALLHVPRAADPIDILWYRPVASDTGPRPLILISPILGNRRLLVTMFAGRFAAMGYHAAIVFRKELDFDPDAALETAEDELRLLVMRSRQALDWLVTDPDVDPNRLGSFGVSAGAVIGSLLAGTDARLKAHVLYLGGGPFADVVVDSEEDRFARYGEELRARRGLTREDVRSTLRRTVLTDPVRLAPRVPREDVLLVIARRDASVPTRHGLALWEAMGRPEIVLTPFGHRTTWVLLPWLETLAADFFSRRFGDALAAPETKTGGGLSPPPVVR